MSGCWGNTEEDQTQTWHVRESFLGKWCPQWDLKHRWEFARWALGNWKMLRDWSRVCWDKAQGEAKGQVMGNILNHLFIESCFIWSSGDPLRGFKQRNDYRLGNWERSLWIQQWWEWKRVDWYRVSTRASFLSYSNKAELSSQHKREPDLVNCFIKKKRDYRKPKEPLLI